MAEEKKFLDYDGVLYSKTVLKQKIDSKLSNKVDKDGNKVLSDNNYTTAEKEKLAGLENYTLPVASTDTLGGVKIGAGLAMNEGVLSATGGGTADSVDWSNVQNKPTKVSDFQNDSGFQTSEQVNSAIASAISGIQGISYSIVDELPLTGEAGVIYLKSNSGINNNIYDEYIWITDKFEKIGTTAVDLTNYLQSDDLVEITNGEIDTIFADF